MQWVKDHEEERWHEERVGEEAELNRWTRAAASFAAGDSRAALRAMRSGGIWSASPATVDKVKTKYRCDAGSASLVQEPSVLEAARGRRAAFVTVKALSKVLDELQVGKSPGISGWRNDMVKCLGEFGASLRRMH